MTNQQIIVCTFILCMATVALLYYVLRKGHADPLVWKIGLTVCMVAIGGAALSLFTPDYKRYGSLAGISGLLVMIACVAIARTVRTPKNEIRNSRGYAIQAAALFVLGSILAYPMFQVSATQDTIETRQIGFFGMLFEIRQIGKQNAKTLGDIQNSRRLDSVQVHANTKAIQQLISERGLSVEQYYPALRKRTPRKIERIHVEVAPLSPKTPGLMPGINRPVEIDTLKARKKSWFERIFSGRVRVDSLAVTHRNED